MDTEYCTDCRSETEVAYDHATGDAICTQCGLVLDSHMIDEVAEWRVFTNDDSTDKADPVRVGKASNPLLNGVEPLLEIVIEKKGWKNKEGGENEGIQGKKGFKLPGLPAVGGKACTALQKGFKRIEDVTEKLRLCKTVQDLACELYRKVYESKIGKGRKLEPILGACVVIASQQLNLSINPTVVSEAVNAGGKTEILKVKLIILRELKKDEVVEQPTEIRPVDPIEDMKRFGHDLMMKSSAIKAAQEMMRKADGLPGMGRSPKTISVGLLYVACLLDQHRTSFEEMARVTGMSAGTIKKSYKELHPYVASLVPSGFAQPEEVRKLPIPGAHTG